MGRGQTGGHGEAGTSLERNPSEPAQARCPRCRAWVHLLPGTRRHCHNCALWLVLPG